MADVPCLDVRADLQAGAEPLPKILDFVRTLPPGQPWKLLATFEPIPLLKLMAGKGYRGQPRQLAPGNWEVLFTPAPKEGGDDASPVPSAAPAPTDLPRHTLDNRGLTPPEPMIRTLEALEHLPEGHLLEVWNDREPAFLYPELARRGWRQETARHPEGVRIRIWRDRSEDSADPQDAVLDVRALPHHQRHDLIFTAVDALPEGRGVVVVNDHDPRPLRYQLETLYGADLTWTYLTAGPEVWRVRIARAGAPRHSPRGGAAS